MGNPLILIAGVIAVAALFTAAYRFLVGPHAADRVVAFDVLTIISISIIAAIAYTGGRVIYLDIAVVYGLLSFLGVIIVARYLERGL